MDDLIFDRLAEMRAAAEARAQRIYERATVLEKRRRELHERMDAIRPVTISPAAAASAERPSDESVVSVSVAA